MDDIVPPSQKSLTLLWSHTQTLSHRGLRLRGSVHGGTTRHDTAKPRSIHEVISCHNTREWIDVIKDEMESMRTN